MLGSVSESPKNCGGPPWFLSLPALCAALFLTQLSFLAIEIVEQRKMIRSSVDSVDSRQHVYLTESEIGLGDVPADSIVEALVELNNSGSAAVSFARPAVSCGCIVTSMPANMLQPGASMQVGVKIRTGSVAETITRHVTFMSETNEFICEAAIRFNVVTPFDFVVDGAITSRLWMDNDLRDEATLQLKMQSGFEFVSLTTDAVIISPSARQTEFNDAPHRYTLRLEPGVNRGLVVATCRNITTEEVITRSLKIERPSSSPIRLIPELIVCRQLNSASIRRNVIVNLHGDMAIERIRVDPLVDWARVIEERPLSERRMLIVLELTPSAAVAVASNGVPVLRVVDSDNEACKSDLNIQFHFE